MENKTRDNPVVPALGKYLSPLAVWALSFGYAVGWGSFVMPGSKFLPDAGPLGTIVGMLAGVAVMCVIGWNYHALAQRDDSFGGVYSYTKKAFGHDYAFLTAWFLSLAYICVLWANSTAMILVARFLYGDALQIGHIYTVAGFEVYFGESALAVSTMVLAGVVCLCRKRFAAAVQTVLALFFVAAVAFAFVAACKSSASPSAAMKPAFSSGGTPFMQVLRILAMLPWAFVGFEAVSHSTSEFRFRKSRMFPVLLAGIVASAAVYLMLALLPVFSVPCGCRNWAEYLANLKNYSGLDAMPVFAAVRTAMGGAGVALLGVTMLAAIFTGIIGTFIALSRLLLALAEDGVMPRSAWFAKVDSRGSPSNAILFILLASLPIPFFGRTAISWPIDVSSIGAAFAYCAVSASALKLAKSQGGRGLAATGVVGIAMSIVFCFLLIVPNYVAGETLSAESYLLLVIWCMLGFIFYRHVFKWDPFQRFGRTPIVWAGIIILIFYSSLMWVRFAAQDATDRTITDIMRYSSEHLHARDSLEVANAELEAEEVFITGRMNSLNSRLLVNDIVQLALLSLSLLMMFNLYAIQRKREERLEIANAKAEERDKAKSTFLSNMSHDIRTPLNAIIGYTELSKRDGVDEPRLRTYISKIEASSHHLLALVNDVLEMSRIEAGKMQLEPLPIDLVETLSETKDMFATQMSVKHIDFSVDAADVRHPRVMCDKNRLNRVLLNLVSNAWKFTPENGHVKITLREKDSAAGGEGVYELSVKDDGIGMEKDFAAHVFDAFERERSATVSGIQGTGLGMSITKSIVELMKGSITVATERGKGTEFTIRLALPFAGDSGAAEKAAPAAASQPSGPVDFKGKRLLLVEDNEINREIASTVLGDAGFEVDEAENGQIAVEKIAQNGAGWYCAVLMDVQMPVMNGYEATRAIRAMGIDGISDLPIIALSANAFETDVKDALEAGMNAHVAKPLKIPLLMKKLAELVH